LSYQNINEYAGAISIARAVESKVLKFKVLKVNGEIMANVVVSRNDARAIRSSAKIQRLLKTCHVTFVVDKQIAGIVN
jgi:hypothetical protein